MNSLNELDNRLNNAWKNCIGMVIEIDRLRDLINEFITESGEHVADIQSIKKTGLEEKPVEDA
jgi:hypothetical protein